MTVGGMLDIMNLIAAAHGRDVQVFVVDGEGEYDFTVTLDEEALGQPQLKVVYLDTTWVPNQDGSGPTRPMPPEG